MQFLATIVLAIFLFSSASETTNLKEEPACRPGEIYYEPAEYCDEYWTCYLGTAIPNECSGGRYWNDDLQICDDPANVDTSNCIIPPSTTESPTTQPPTTISTPAPVTPTPPDCTPGDIYNVPSENCDQYWTCYNGSPILNDCLGGQFWNNALQTCDNPDNVDTSNCQIPPSTTAPPTTQSTTTPTTAPTTTTEMPTAPVCRPGDIYNVPSENCNQYWTCYNETPILNTCPGGQYWNSSLEVCDDPSNVDTSNCNV